VPELTWAVGDTVIAGDVVATIARLTETQLVTSDGGRYYRATGEMVGPRSRYEARPRVRPPKEGEVQAIAHREALVRSLHEIERLARRYTGWERVRRPATAEQVEAAQLLVRLLGAE
jgi:hypothetical protein